MFSHVSGWSHGPLSSFTLKLLTGTTLLLLVLAHQCVTGIVLRVSYRISRHSDTDRSISTVSQQHIRHISYLLNGFCQLTRASSPPTRPVSGPGPTSDWYLGSNPANPGGGCQASLMQTWCALDRGNRLAWEMGLSPCHSASDSPEC